MYVGDYEPFQFLVFAPDGSWLRTVRPTPLNSPRTVNVLASGALVLGRENHGAPDPAAFAERSLTIERYDAECTLRDTAGDIVAERARVAKQYENLDAGMKVRLLEPLTSGKRPVADRFPAFGMLMLGADDGIWIREFPRPAETIAYHWIA